jgi:hypothetical protein
MVDSYEVEEGVGVDGLAGASAAAGLADSVDGLASDAGAAVESAEEDEAPLEAVLLE